MTMYRHSLSVYHTDLAAASHQHAINFWQIGITLGAALLFFATILYIGDCLLNRYWWNIDILKNVDRASRDYLDSVSTAGESDHGILPALKTTEAVSHWALLYQHAQLAQIHPDSIKHMKRVDLEYLAGMIYPHPDLAEEGHGKITKLMGNVNRAKTELDNRNIWRTTILTAGAAIGGAILGALLASG